MKKLALLKTCINILYYISLFVIILLPILGIVLLIQIYGDGIKFEDKIYVEVGAFTILKVILNYALGLIPVYCLFLFRKVLILFEGLNIFHQDVINLFHTIGKYLLILTIGVLVVQLVPLDYTFLIVNKNGFTTEHVFTHGYHFNTRFVEWIGVGLFFLVLSEVFKAAKDIKEENDLTI